MHANQSPHAEAESLPYIHFDLYLQDLEQLIVQRLKSYATGSPMQRRIPLIPSNGQADPFATFVLEHNLNADEYLLLLLALVPHLKPDFLDQVISSQLEETGDFPLLGGVRGKNCRGMIPTGETALFLLVGEAIGDRIRCQQLFDQEHLFAKQRILWLEDLAAGEPAMSGRIILSPEYLTLFTTGRVHRPRFSTQFPAQRVETEMVWEDLVLSEETMIQVNDLEDWLAYGDILYQDWGMGRKLKPGYRVLFHGPPGTGKTLTATLLGKYTSRDVYKIDLSMLVSKYIGETEKNLSHLFQQAENKDWILFFDEADAIFGKRTQVKDAHDKFANQEVSYLLQRVESYNGLVILASNLKNNLDDAFIRRFQAIIPFPIPQAKERLQLWLKGMPAQVSLESPGVLDYIAKRHALSGSEIMNAIQYCCLKLLSSSRQQLTQDEIEDSIRREFQKRGKIMR